jgi:hypothetical protein
VDLGPLQQVALVNQPVEFSVVYEDVVDAINLAGPWPPRGYGDRNPDVR